MKLIGYTSAEQELYRNVLFETLSASIPKDPRLKIQIYNAEIAPGGYTDWHCHNGATFLVALQGFFEAHLGLLGNLAAQYVVVKFGAGSPAEIQLTPSALEKMKTVNLKDDPWKQCKPVGQFRMMAHDNTVMEILPARSLIFILFEDFTHGFMRKLYFNRSHEQRSMAASDPAIPVPKLTWFGASIAYWEKDAFVIDALDFDDRTWLNDSGAQHSESLHTVERIRPIRGRQFLEYKMTADDPQILAKPYTYVRYFKKIDRELEDDNCIEEQ